MTTEDTPEAVDALMAAVAANDPDRVDDLLDALPPGQTSRLLSSLEDDDRAQLLAVLSARDAADLIEELPPEQAAELVLGVAPEKLAAILAEMPSDERADLFGDLGDSEVEAVLRVMDPEDAREVQTLAAYPDDVAGGIMVNELLSYPRTHTVDDVVTDLREHAAEYGAYNVQYVFVTDAAGGLVGVMRLRDLLLAQPGQLIADLMIGDPLALSDRSTLDELRDFFDRHDFFGVPILDAAGRLVGIVHRAAVEEALGEQAGRDFRRAQGIVHEELRSMPTLTRARRRLGWLSINIGLNVVAASVIAFYQDTLSQVIALAVFLPIVSDMSGCTGNQAVAVSVRELALGVVRPREIVYVWMKEVAVGAINGLVLGALLAAVAVAWKGNPYLGLVVGVAMFANTVVAVSLGGVLPLALKRLRVDPALASGPILTTVTDMCGFLLVLGTATLFLPLLV